MESLTARLPQSLYSAKQVRDHEPEMAALASIPMYQLMENAGAAVFELASRYFADCNRMVVCCGKGNNGGDGYVVARLAIEAGLEVDVIQIPENSTLTGDAGLAQKAYLAAGGIIRTSIQWEAVKAKTLIIDALLGTGINGDVSGMWAELIFQINQSIAPVVSIDLPSGLHADTGCVLSCAVKADYTVTFVAVKRGLVTGASSEYCGQLWFAGLGIAQLFSTNIKTHIHLLAQSGTLPKREMHAHKGTFGHVFIVGGQKGMAGAVRLSGEAALRTGAGLVSIISAKGNAAVIQAGRPELMVTEHNGSICAQPFQRASVVAIGPGLGTDVESAAIFDVAMNVDRSLVVDADALNLLAMSPKFSDTWILTPHPAEAARLLGITTAEVNGDRYSAAMSIATKYGGVCLLKGAGTVISDGKQSFVNQTGNPGMATAGMGDTLTGIIAALVAQGMSLLSAATLGATIHGVAGDRAAEQGQIGLLATDVINKIRQVINE